MTVGSGDRACCIVGRGSAFVQLFYCPHLATPFPARPPDHVGVLRVPGGGVGVPAAAHDAEGQGGCTCIARRARNTHGVVVTWRRCRCVLRMMQRAKVGGAVSAQRGGGFVHARVWQRRRARQLPHISTPGGEGAPLQLLPRRVY